jgi:hypothetical protein
MWKFISERWFDIALTLLFLGLEWYNHVKSNRAERKMNAKLKKIKEEVEYTTQLAYGIQEDKFQDAKDG